MACARSIIFSRTDSVMGESEDDDADNEAGGKEDGADDDDDEEEDDDDNDDRWWVKSARMERRPSSSCLPTKSFFLRATLCARSSISLTSAGCSTRPVVDDKDPDERLRGDVLCGAVEAGLMGDGAGRARLSCSGGGFFESSGREEGGDGDDDDAISGGGSLDVAAGAGVEGRCCDDLSRWASGGRLPLVTSRTISSMVRPLKGLRPVKSS